MNSSSNNMQKETRLWKNCEDRTTGKNKLHQKNKDWLDLTLGFSSSSDHNPSKLITMHDDGGSSSSSLSSSPRQQGQDMASGFVESDDLRSTEKILVPWKERHHHDQGYLPIPFPSSSSSSFLSCKPTSVLQSHGSVHRLSRPVLNVNHYFGRPHPAGLWFTLRSTINRNGEVLPQIPKAYIRLKDANVTVFMVQTYLVRKLGLTNEAEVEVSCMGQKLLHSQTIEYVRDAIWLPKLVEFVYSNPALDLSQIVHHLLSLDYGKSCFPNSQFYN